MRDRGGGSEGLDKAVGSPDRASAAPLHLCEPLLDATSSFLSYPPLKIPTNVCYSVS